MKILLKILISLLGVFFVFQSFSYDLTDKDNTLLDNFEERLFEIIDERKSVSPERVEKLLEDILEKKKLKERTRVLVEVILDDLQYAYYLGEYEDILVSAEDCYEDEYFDESDQKCYFVYGNDEFDDESDFSGEQEKFSEQESEEEILAAYKIEENKITLLQGQAHVKHIEVWNMFIKLIPIQSRQDFKNFRVFDNPNADTSAHVTQDEKDSTKWNLTINIDSFYDEGSISGDSVSILIHEFAHLLTLDKLQVRYYPSTENETLLERFSENCSTNLLQEGCLNEKSYLNSFINNFWSNKEQLEQVREGEVDIYIGNEENFITDYAATNPGEDIAESFTYFVLRPKPTGDTIADKKLHFFYNYKSLESLRKQIRVGIKNM